MQKNTATTLVITLFLVIAAGAMIVGCGDSTPETLDRYVIDYGSQIEELRSISTNHHRGVVGASGLDEVAEAEKYYREMIRGIIDEMRHTVDKMAQCAHGREHGPRTTALRSDVEAIERLCAEHREQMVRMPNYDDAFEREESFRLVIGDALRMMGDTHGEMMMDAEECLCAPEYGNDGMMDHMM